MDKITLILKIIVILLGMGIIIYPWIYIDVSAIRIIIFDGLVVALMGFSFIFENALNNTTAAFIKTMM